jgi:hypothetical protein
MVGFNIRIHTEVGHPRNLTNIPVLLQAMVKAMAQDMDRINLNHSITKARIIVRCRVDIMAAVEALVRRMSR